MWQEYRGTRMTVKRKGKKVYGEKNRRVRKTGGLLGGGVVGAWGGDR